MVEKSGPKGTSGVEGKEHKPRLTMLPLFSKRSFILLPIGFIVGAVLGLGYFAMSPSLSSPDTSTTAASGASGGLASIVRTPTAWEAKVEMQIVNPGFSYQSPTQLVGKGQYYVTKANSMPFLDFLSQELAEQAPEYSHTVGELAEMIKTELNRRDDPPVININLTASSIEEALFLLRFIPEVFPKYLMAEESNTHQQKYQKTLTEIDSVKSTIIEAEQELSALNPQGAASDVSKDPTYMVLNAKIEALEPEVSRLAAELAATEESKMQPQEYEKTLREMETVTSAVLSEAKEELTTLMREKAANDIRNHPDYIALNAKIISLDLELDRRMTELSGLVAEGGTGKDYSYANTISAVERISTALSEAKKELAVLEAQIDFDNLAQDLEYQLAKDKVVNLSKELTTLRLNLALLHDGSSGGKGGRDIEAELTRTSTALAKSRKELADFESQWDAGCDPEEDLECQIIETRIENFRKELSDLNVKLSSSLVKDVDAPEPADYLALQTPSMPRPVLPMRLRDALVMGAIVGIGGAWIAVNFRWLIKGLSSSSEAPEEEEDEA